MPAVNAPLPQNGPDTSQDKRIVLLWLTRLRWLAVAGQVAAIGVAHWALELILPLWPVLAVVATTFITNVLLVLRMRRAARAPSWLVPLVLILDIGLLTELLYFTGGPTNPFSTLYLVNVAMAVVVLDSAWAWGIVAAAIGSYGALFIRYEPLRPLESRPDLLDAGRWISLALAATLISYFIRRVTGALRRRDAELQAMKEQVAKSEQIASLTTLAAGAAHELNTPLGTIAVVAKEIELATQKSGAEVVADDARLIRSEVERCRKILDRMRVDKAEALSQQPTAIALSDLIHSLCEDLKPGEGKRLRLRAAPDLTRVVIPRRATIQALVVMVRNAFDASPESAVVDLTIQRQPVGRITFEVADTGCGMPDEVVRRVGEPFFTTKEPGLGMGLGVFLARQVAERYGGSLRLESQPGQGTRSILELPEGADAPG